MTHLIHIKRVNYWFNQGHYNKNSDLRIEALTEEEILETINNNNVSGIFLKDFNFKELLGDVKYDAYGRIIGRRYYLDPEISFHQLKPKSKELSLSFSRINFVEEDGIIIKMSTRKVCLEC